MQVDRDWSCWSYHGGGWLISVGGCREGAWASGSEVEYDVGYQYSGMCGRIRSTGPVRCCFRLHETTSAQSSGASISVTEMAAGHAYVYSVAGREGIASRGCEGPEMRRLNPQDTSALRTEHDVLPFPF